MEAGQVEAPPPWKLVKAWLCQFYHCLPSELEQEEADEALLLYQLVGIYDNYRDKRPGQKQYMKKLG